MAKTARVFRLNDRVLLELNGDGKEIGVDLDFIINDNPVGSEGGQTVKLINKSNLHQTWDVSFSGVLDQAGTPVGSTATAVRDHLSTVTKGFSSASGGSEAGGCMPVITGQTSSYNLDDDGANQRGRLVDFVTLSYLNPFGTNERFTDTLGGQVYADGIVMNWASNKGDGEYLAYYKTLIPTTVNWNQCVNDCAAVSIGPYISGWAMTNFNELNEIWDKELFNPLNYPPFNIPAGSPNNLWTSSTARSTTVSAMVIQANGLPGIGGKAGGIGIFSGIACRIMTVTGTTIT